MQWWPSFDGIAGCLPGGQPGLKGPPYEQNETAGKGCFGLPPFLGVGWHLPLDSGSIRATGCALGRSTSAAVWLIRPRRAGAGRTPRPRCRLTRTSPAQRCGMAAIPICCSWLLGLPQRSFGWSATHCKGLPKPDHFARRSGLFAAIDEVSVNRYEVSIGEPIIFYFFLSRA